MFVLIFAYLIDNIKCPFYAKSLPNPLPEKICLLLRKIGKQNCKVYGEGKNSVLILT